MGAEGLLSKGKEVAWLAWGRGSIEKKEELADRIQMKV